LKQLKLIQILRINASKPADAELVAAKARRVNLKVKRAPNGERAASATRRPLAGTGMWGMAGRGALPRGNAVFGDARKTWQSAGSVRTLVEFNRVPGTTVLRQ
jgi:hypothetical protein